MFEHLTSEAIQFREPASSKVPKKSHGLSGTTWKSRKRGSKGLEIELLARFWQANAIKVRHFSSFALTVGVGQFSVLSSQFSVLSSQFSVFGTQLSVCGIAIENCSLRTVHCFYGAAAMALACTGSVPVALVTAELSLPAVVESNV